MYEAGDEENDVLPKYEAGVPIGRCHPVIPCYRSVTVSLPDPIRENNMKEESRSLRSNQYQIQRKSKSIKTQNSVLMTSLSPGT